MFDGLVELENRHVKQEGDAVLVLKSSKDACQPSFVRIQCTD